MIIIIINCETNAIITAHTLMSSWLIGMQYGSTDSQNLFGISFLSDDDLVLVCSVAPVRPDVVPYGEVVVPSSNRCDGTGERDDTCLSLDIFAL